MRPFYRAELPRAIGRTAAALPEARLGGEASDAAYGVGSPGALRAHALHALHAQLRARAGEAAEGLAALREIGTGLGAHGALRTVPDARMLWRLADAAALAGHHETAQAAAREGLDILRAASSETHPLAARRRAVPVAEPA